jgi:hypothetical protein
MAIKPIDVIKNKLDSDFTKYHSSTLCKILSDDHVKNIRGVGLCALVSPVNKYNVDDPLTVGDEYTFPVLLINRPGKWMESNISSKYYVLTMNTVEDRSATTVGFLVSKTIATDMEVFKSSVDANSKAKDSQGKPLETRQKENINDSQTG